MKTFIINIPSAVERRQKLEVALGEHGVDFEFFPAVTPADRPERFFSGSGSIICRLETGRQTMQPNEIACYASHVCLWKKCIELDEPIIVLEDDVQPSATFARDIAAIDSVIEKFGFIRLEASVDDWNYYRNHEDKKPKPLTAEVIGELVIEHPTFMHLRTSAYALTPDAAGKFLAASTTAKCPVDNFMRRIWSHHQPMFMSKPPLFDLTDTADESQIGGRVARKKKGFFLVRQFIRRSRHVYWWWARRSSWREARRIRSDRRYGMSCD